MGLFLSNFIAAGLTCYISFYVLLGYDDLEIRAKATVLTAINYNQLECRYKL